MFSKFQPQAQPQAQPQPSSPPKRQPPHHPTPQYLHHFHHLTSSTSDDPNIADPTPTDPISPPPSKKPRILSSSSEDGATIEVGRRPRGRPPGSKNKPKPPIIITREPDPTSASPYILEIAGGVDIIDSLTRFTRRQGFGLCVLSAYGTVSNVTLRQSSAALPAGTFTVHGRLDIVSLSAVLLGGGGGGTTGYAHDGMFTISVAGQRGQTVGGRVVGALLAAGSVYVTATSFRSPICQKLPVDINEDVRVWSNGSDCGGGGGGGQRNTDDSSGLSGEEGDNHNSSERAAGGAGGGGDADSCGSLLGICSLGSDVLWAPTAARPQPPPLPPHHPYCIE